MRKSNIEFIQPGMTVAESVYSSNGRVLVASGVVLNERLLERLKDLGVQSLYITDDVFDGDYEAPEIVSEKIRLEAVKNVKSIYESLKSKRQLNLSTVRDTVDIISDEIIRNRDVLFACSDIRSFDDYLFNHCVNVCILSLIVASNMGYNELKLRELGIGALLHDIGMISVDQSILNKPGELSSAETDTVRHHTQTGFDALRQCDIPLLAAHIAFQHHERWNGSGYPRGLSGTDIHEYARIVAVADVFDALMADRPHRAAYSLDESIEYITTMSNFHFEPRCVEALLANVTTFQIGSVVKLNTGIIGQVLKVNRLTPTRPLLRIVFDHNGNLLKPYQLDLYQDNSLQVVHVLSDQDVAYLVKRAKKSS